MRFCPPPRRLKVCGYLLVVLSLCAPPQRAWAQSSPSVQKIDLSGSGHVRCKDSSGNLLQAVEMDATHTPAYATSAGIRGQNLTAGVTLHHTTAGQFPFTGKAHFSVVFEYPDFPNANGQIPITVTPAEQSVTIAAGGTTNLTLTLGALPDQVRGGSLRILCTFKTPEGTYLHSQTDFLPFYVLYDTPTAPQENPWEGVLYQACWWARGENTQNGVAKKLTLGVFFYRLAYPEDTGSHGTDDDTDDFLLTNFLASSGYQSANCVDVSDFLLICANAVGLDFEVTRYTDFWDGGFLTIPLCLIGSDPFWPDVYTSSSWGFHQVCHPVGTASTYDACAAHKYDLNGAVYENPPAGWLVSSYWQVDPTYPKRLVKLPNPSTMHALTTFTPGVQ